MPEDERRDTVGCPFDLNGNGRDNIIIAYGYFYIFLITVGMGRVIKFKSTKRLETEQ